MSWTTVYISGKADFREEVRKKLSHTSLPHMPGSIEAQRGEWFIDLYWLDGTKDIRDFKLAIGAKLIFKYRLHFCTSLEEFMDSLETRRSSEFTSREREMIEEMRAAS